MYHIIPQWYVYKISRLNLNEEKISFHIFHIDLNEKINEHELHIHKQKHTNIVHFL